MTRTALLLVGTLTMLYATETRADPITIRELGNHVTEATVTVDAPASEIYSVVTDYARWPDLLSDVTAAQIEQGGTDTARVRFRSKVFDHEVTVQFNNVPGREIRFQGIKGPPGGRASGSYFLEPVDGGARTRVVARLFLDVVGVPSLFVKESKLREMREAKLRADMADVLRALERRRPVTAQ
jgi:hypothetical protein